LPDSDSPAIFGLPLNIQRSLERAKSDDVIAQVCIYGIRWIVQSFLKAVCLEQVAGPQSMLHV
jgi:hypothetical protein